VLDSTAVKMAPKIFEKVGVLLQRREPKHVKYDYDAHMHLEAQGFFNEGLVSYRALSLSHTISLSQP